MYSPPSKSKHQTLRRASLRSGTSKRRTSAPLAVSPGAFVLPYNCYELFGGRHDPDLRVVQPGVHGYPLRSWPAVALLQRRVPTCGAERASQGAYAADAQTEGAPVVGHTEAGAAAAGIEYYRVLVMKFNTPCLPHWAKRLTRTGGLTPALY